MGLSRLLGLSARFFRQRGAEIFLWIVFVYFSLRLIGRTSIALTTAVILLGAITSWFGRHQKQTDEKERSDYPLIAALAIGVGLLIYLKTSKFGLPGVMAAAAAAAIIFLIYMSATNQK